MQHFLNISGHRSLFTKAEYLDPGTRIQKTDQGHTLLWAMSPQPHTVIIIFQPTLSLPEDKHK